VARTINRSLAAYMVLTGLPLSAQEALNAGLVSKVFSENVLGESSKLISACICSA
jgi:enoyl-CoA hydratase/carnithine racemase